MALPPLVAELVAKTDQFQAGLARAAQSAQKSAGDITGSLAGIKASLAGFGAGISVVGVAGVFAKMIQDTANLGDELYKMSQRSGVSVESLSTLRYAADLSGVAVADLDSLLVKLNKKLGEAGAGGESAGQFLKQFGIDAVEVKNGTIGAEEALKRIADRFANSPDGINKTAAAMEAFGKAGASIIPFLNQGRDGIEGLQSEATKLGLKMSTESAQRMEAFNDQMRTLKFATEGAAVEMASRFMPQLEGITRAMRDATIEGGKLAGIIAGLSVYKYGTHQDKNDADLVRLTEKKLQLENDIAAARNQGNQVRVNTFTGELNRVEAQLKTTLAYRGELEQAAKIEKAAAAAREAARAGGGQLELPGGTPARIKAAQDLTAAAERQARLVQEAEEKAASDTTGAWSAVAEERNKELEQLRKDQAAMWQQIYAEIDAAEERRIAAGQALFESLKVTKRETQDATKFARDLGLTFSSAFEDALVDGKKLSDVIDGLGRDLARIVGRKTVTEPLGNAVSDFIGDIFKSGGPQQLAGPSDGGGLYDGVLKFLGFRAGGGPVTAGGAYVVGERGPELFVPNAAGTVVPNGAIGGGVTYIQHFHIDSRSDRASVEMGIARAMAAHRAELAASFTRNGMSQIARGMA